MADLKSLVQQHYDGFREGDLDAAVAVFTDDCVTIDPGAGQMAPEQFRAYGESFKTALPDGRFEVRRMIEADGVCVVEGTLVGTHTGPLVGPQGELPPSGRQIALDFCDVFTGRDGKIGEHRVYYDQMAMLGQLGALEQPAPAG
jgi:steroid delta-isomerase-like uncharacterized protein